jgi:hypothetical protein
MHSLLPNCMLSHGGKRQDADPAMSVMTTDRLRHHASGLISVLSVFFRNNSSQVLQIFRCCGFYFMQILTELRKKNRTEKAHNTRSADQPTQTRFGFRITEVSYLRPHSRSLSFYPLSTLIQDNSQPNRWLQLLGSAPPPTWTHLVCRGRRTFDANYWVD